MKITEITDEEVAVLERQHRSSADASTRTDRPPHCVWDDEPWPCLTIRLVERLREVGIGLHYSEKDVARLTEEVRVLLGQRGNLLERTRRARDERDAARKEAKRLRSVWEALEREHAIARGRIVYLEDLLSNTSTITLSVEEWAEMVASLRDDARIPATARRIHDALARSLGEPTFAEQEQAAAFAAAEVEHEDPLRSTALFGEPLTAADVERLRSNLREGEGEPEPSAPPSLAETPAEDDETDPPFDPYLDGNPFI